MNWQEIRSHPALEDLPFKLETDRWGHIMMSPASKAFPVRVELPF